MAKTIKAIVNTGKEDTNKSFDVVQGSGAKGKPTRIAAVKGARYELEDPTAKNVGPENIRSKRVGKNLHVMLDGSKEADLIIEGYYDEANQTENKLGLYGRAEDGKLYEYIPEVPSAEGMPVNLADGGKPVSQVLGGGSVADDFALSGLFLAGAGFNALGAVAGVVGAAALAGGAGGGGTTTGGLTPAQTALAKIEAYNNGDGTNPAAPTVQDYEDAGVTGVTSNNLAAVNAQVLKQNTGGADTAPEVQALVTAANNALAKIEAYNNGDGTTPAALTVQDYADAGITGVTADNLAAVNAQVLKQNVGGADTVPEVQALVTAANNALAKIEAYNNGDGTTPAALTVQDYADAGIKNVTSTNLAAVNAKVLAENPGGADTVPEVQALVASVATAEALNTISAAAQANNATSTALATTVYAAAGVTGVDANNVAAINSALDSAAVNGAAADTTAKVQAIVDAYKAILAEANDTTNAAGDTVADATPTADPTAPQYQAIGVTLGDAATDADNLALLNDIVGASQAADVDTVAELNELARIANAIQLTAAGGTPNPALTATDFAKAGIANVTTGNLADVLTAIAAKNNDGTETDSLAELQGIVNQVAAASLAALDSIKTAAEANSATSGNLAATVFTTAGVTGVDSTNLAAVQSALDSATVNGAAADTINEVQALVDAANAIKTNADGTANNYATNPTQAQYAALGVTGVDTAAEENLLGEVIDAKAYTAVDSTPELQALADAAQAVMNGNPTKAQLELLGITGVTDGNLPAVQAALAAAATGNKDSLSEVQGVVTGVVNAAAALDSIKAAAEANNATSSNLAATVFTTAGVTGVDSTNLAAIQSALDSAAVNGAAADTKAEVQAIVDAANAIKSNADGTANNYATNPTQAQYAALGVTGVDTAAEENLLGDVIDAKAYTAVDSTPELQALANAAQAVMDGNPTKAQLELLGITGVTDGNLPAVQAALAAAAAGNKDSLSEVQGVVTAAVDALNAIKDAAQNNSATATSPSVTQYETIGVTGVDASNLAAINSALNDPQVQGAQADTKAEVQAIVDAYKAILGEANGSTADANAQDPTAAQYAAIGVTGVDAGAEESLLGDVIGDKTTADVDTVNEVQTLADAVQAVMNGTATKAQLEALGITGVTDNNLTAVQAALAAANDATDLNSKAGLQGVVSAAVNALDAIKNAAENNNATATTPSTTQYAAAGVTGVTAGNLAAINDALNDTDVQGAQADTKAEVQTIVDAYKAILDEANGATADANAQDPTFAQYAAIGVSGVDAGAEESLLGDVIGTKDTTNVDTVAEVQALANAVQAVMDGNATKAQLELLGVTGVTDSNLAAVQAALTAATDATQLNTLAGLQSVVDTATVHPGQAVIDLGASGKLIAPVQVEGKWYYYWDRSGNGDSTGSDNVTMTTLASTFNHDINGNVNPAGAVIDETYRYGIINGVLVALPTVNGAQTLPQGLAAQNGTAATGGGTTNNSSYDDLLAVWDNYNGVGTGSNVAATLTGWNTSTAYWTASSSGGYHLYAGLNSGSVSQGLDSQSILTALEVVKTNAAPVLDVSQSPTLTSISSGASAPVNGNTTAGDLVSSLVGGITDGDSGASKGIAITGVHAGGTLYYSVDGGTTWLTATGISSTNALLLAADSNTRVMYKSDGTQGSVTDAITFKAWDMTQHITEGVYANSSVTGGKSEFSTASDTVAVTVTPPAAGDAVINLGASGNLIAPVQVEGKWYYYWDRSGNGTNADTGSLNGGVDYVSMTTLASTFNHDINGNVNQAGAVINDTYRYGTINGVFLALPTANGGQAYPQGMSADQNGTTAAGGGATNNSTYDDLLAVWDNYNSTGTGTNILGTPTGWLAHVYWTATTSSAGHAAINLNVGTVANHTDTGTDYVALEVVKTNAAPVLDATQSPTLTSISSGASAPTDGNTTAGDLVSSLVGGITDGDSGASKGIAITGVHAGGTLYYSLDGGAHWLTASGLSDTNALLLAGDANTRVMYKDATAGSVTDAITFKAWDMTQHITEGVYVNSSVTGGKSEFSTASDTVAVTVTAPPSPAGNAVIDLGTYGKLINGVQVEGKWYYYWDRSGDGTEANTGSLNGGLDYTNHDVLDAIFNQDINGNVNSGVNTTDVYRYATINGVKVALTTMGGTVPTHTYAVNTSVNDYTSSNPTYDDLLAIWDGKATADQTSGLPTGWQIGTYWSATESTSGSHMVVSLYWGMAVTATDSNNNYCVALQVLPVVIDLNRDGVLSYGQVTMDVNGDGALDVTKWAGASDGVLVWDKFHDGLVHDNSQYAFAQYATTYANGLDAHGKAPTDLSGLADAFDSNHDGVFNAADAQFAEFKVWQDANQNGVSDAGEVRGLLDWGITSINLSSDNIVRTPTSGVTEAGRTTATATDGSSVLVSDAAFEYHTLTLKDVLQTEGAPAPAASNQGVYTASGSSFVDQLLIDQQMVQYAH